MSTTKIDPRLVVAVPGSHRVDIGLDGFHSHGGRVYWTPRPSCNSYVIVASERGYFLTEGGVRVDCLSINGGGEVRWVVERYMVESGLRAEEQGRFASGDAGEQLGAYRHFKLTLPPAEG